MADRTVKVHLNGDISDFNRAMLQASAGAKAFSSSLNSSNDQMTNLVQTSLALAPALVPIGAAAVPAISGLTNQLAFAAAGAGVAALAFSGIGDALKATNDYAVEPTEANLEKMRQSLAELGPAGREFVGFLQELRPQLQGLQDLAQEGLLPGVESGLTDLMTLLPQAERIVSEIATSMGDLFSEAGSNLADPRWREFFTFLETEARPTLIAMGRTLGNFAEGFAELWMAFDPLSDQFSHSFLEMSRDFSAWADGLSQTEGFQEFVDYIATNGPKAWDALSAIGNALLQIVEAAAPVGAAVLPVIESLADGIAAIADSDLGPAILGIVALTSALGRLKAVSVAANSSALGGLFGKSAYSGAAKAAKDLPAATSAFMRFDAAAARASMSAEQFAVANGRMGNSLRGAAKLAGGAGGLAFAMSDLDDKMGVTYTTMGTLIGSGFGPMGAAVGFTAGAIMDLTHQTDKAAESIKNFDQAFDSAGSLEQQAAVIAELREQVEWYNKAAEATGNGDIEDDALKLTEQLLALEAQFKSNTRAADDAKFAEAGLGDAMAFSSDEARAETLALLENIRIKNDAADAAQNAFSAETNYRQALKDAKKQADSNNAGIKGSSDAALKNREALDRLVTGWDRVADAGNATRKDMLRARANFIQVAQSMGVSRAAAEKLAYELFHMPKRVDTTVRVEGVAGALTAIQHVKDRLLSLDGTTAQTFVQIKESVGRAEGGPMWRPTGLVHGPGGPKDDLIDAKLSNKEFVVNAAATAKYLPELYAINAQRFAYGGETGGRVQRMADGGSVATLAAPAVNVTGGMTEAQFERVAVRVLSRGVRIVGKPGNQRLEIMGG